MGLNSGVFGNLLATPKSPEEYAAERQSAESNKLGLLLQRGQYDAQQRGVADDAAYRDAVRGFGPDSGANVNMLRARGLGKQIQIVGDQQHGGTRRCRFEQLAMDIRHRADIESPGRLTCDH